MKYYISYAGGGPNTRSTQLFIAYEDLEFLGKSPWEVPFGEVTSGKDVVDSWYKGYGDMPPWGKGPDQGKLHNRGNAYIRAEFPLIDFIISCAVIDDAKSETQSEPIDLKSKELPIETIQDPRSFLRQDLENQAQPSEPSSISNYPAFRAIMLLAVAISVLLCLYQYNSSPVSAKSQ